MLMKSANTCINEVHVLTMYRGMVNWVDAWLPKLQRHSDEQKLCYLRVRL